MTGLKIGAAAVALAAMPVAAQGDPNAAINAVYDRISAGLRDHDPAMSRGAYTPDVLYLPAMPGAIDRGDRFHERMRRSADRLKADKVDAKLSFRVVSRTLRGDTAIDAGYFRNDMTRASPTPTTQTRYSKFLVVAMRQADGSWKISHDASVPATREAFDAAAPHPGLKYDR